MCAVAKADAVAAAEVDAEDDAVRRIAVGEGLAEAKGDGDGAAQACVFLLPPHFERQLDGRSDLRRRRERNRGRGGRKGASRKREGASRDGAAVDRG